MSDRAALVAAIEADPDNDLPRLVWADWLDEQGDPFSTARARLVRLQCEKDRSPAAEQSALRDLKRLWPDDLQFGRPFQYLAKCFHRGVLTDLIATAADFARALGGSSLCEPLVGVKLYAHSAEQAVGNRELVNRAELRVVRCLQNMDDNDWLSAVVASSHLTRLTHVWCQPADVAAVLSSPSPFRLDRLEVARFHNPDITPAEATELAQRLAASPRLAGLRQLGLLNLFTRAAEWRQLIASPHLPPTLVIHTMHAGDAPRRGSALARDLAARFPGPPA